MGNEASRQERGETMKIPQEILDAMTDIIDNYEFKKSEVRTIVLFMQTLLEYEPKKAIPKAS
jgi:hypothetical protein